MPLTLSDSPINYRVLGNSSIRISEIGLGCASAWGQPWFDERKAIEIVRRAIELGVTVFDTGPSYSQGYAEPRLAKALKNIDAEKFMISTKVGTHIGKGGKLYHDLTSKAILRSVEASRQRLGMDEIPLLYLHGPLIPEMDRELVDTLGEIRNRGWVRWLGVNSFDTDVLESLANMVTFDVVMLDYNVLRINREPLIAKLAQSGKFVVAGSAMANHLYSPHFFWPKSVADVWYSLRALKNYRKDMLRARKFASLETWAEWTSAQVALAFVLGNVQVGVAMFGTTRLLHLEENIAACALTLPESLVRQIRA